MQSPKTTKITSGDSLVEHIPPLATEYGAYTSLDFNKVEQQAFAFADAIENQIEKLIEILLEYETYEVATDEIARTLDHLRNLKENKDYFKLRIGDVAAFLPRNQPLYAFTCFVVIPSLMSHKVHFRIPSTMRGFLPKVFQHLEVFKFFPNIVISSKERIEFLRERSALMINPKTKETKPVTDAVIFTGTSVHSDQLRLVFDRRTLFISNGAGHNPIVIGEDADIHNAVEAVLSLALYNQGQDCAAPNTILVHKKIIDKFMENFHSEFAKVEIGPYHNRSSRVGPISNPEDLKYIETLIVDNREWLDEKTNGVIRTAQAIVEPTIISKPLTAGGNYEESFAPVLFIQEYLEDKELAQYFESQKYAQNAMYVTLYGESEYIKKLIGRPVAGRILHHPDTFLHNTHLHMPGIERGTQPYGGYGHGASSISIYGKTTAMPTLPQRDIFEWVAKPLLDKTINSISVSSLQEFTQFEYKNVEKILRLKSIKPDKHDHLKLSDNTYFDLHSVKTDGSRYVKLEEGNLYRLLSEPNAEYIAALEPDDLKLIRALRILLGKKNEISFDEFSTSLFSIPKVADTTAEENGAKQLKFFKNIYQLLLKQDRGPRLAQFLWELNGDTVDNLLDV